MHRVLCLAVAATVGLFLAGCGGGGKCTDGNVDDSYPKSKYVDLYLQISAPNGDPLGGASVEINGSTVNGPTSDSWSEIGTDAPEEWLGWKYNWVIKDYEVVINQKGEVRDLIVRVSKPGFGPRQATVPIRSTDPAKVYVRLWFTLQPQASEAQAAP